MNKNGLNRQH